MTATTATTKYIVTYADKKNGRMQQKTYVRETYARRFADRVSGQVETVTERSTTTTQSAEPERDTSATEQAAHTAKTRAAARAWREAVTTSARELDRLRACDKTGKHSALDAVALYTPAQRAYVQQCARAGKQPDTAENRRAELNRRIAEKPQYARLYRWRFERVEIARTEKQRRGNRKPSPWRVLVEYDQHGNITRWYRYRKHDTYLKLTSGQTVLDLTNTANAVLVKFAVIAAHAAIAANYRRSGMDYLRRLKNDSFAARNAANHGEYREMLGLSQDNPTQELRVQTRVKMHGLYVPCHIVKLILTAQGREFCAVNDAIAKSTDFDDCREVALLRAYEHAVTANEHADMSIYIRDMMNAVYRYIAKQKQMHAHLLNESTYNARIGALDKQIKNLLDSDSARAIVDFVRDNCAERTDTRMPAYLALRDMLDNIPLRTIAASHNSTLGAVERAAKRARSVFQTPKGIDFLQSLLN